MREDAVKNKRDYHLIVQKLLVIDGRKKDELRFASVIQQKDSVGFYLTAMSDEVKATLSPELLKHLAGSHCEGVPPIRQRRQCMGVEQRRQGMYMNNYVGQTVTVAGDSMHSKAGLKTVASGENSVAVKGHLRAMDLAVDSETCQK